MGARHSGRIAAAACAIVVAIIIGCRIAVYFTGSMTGGYLQYKAYVDSGTVILKTGDTARTWHVEGEWEQSYGGRKPEEFTTPRTLIVIPDESDDSATPARCEILFSGHILDEDTLENSETQAICNFESWNQE